MIEKRKADHIHICVSKNVNAHYNYWDDVVLVHRALPVVEYEEISTEVNVFGKNLQYPIIISGMTGGYAGAAEINENLAIAAEHFKIGMGLGSMRPLLADPGLIDTYDVINDYDIPLKIGNIGVQQLVADTIDDVISVHAELRLDIMAVHLNYAQEVVQPDGDKRCSGALERIAELAKRTPTIVKETGCGITRNVARRLISTGIIGIDVGGMSGTSFVAVEHYRAAMQNNYVKAALGKTYWDWGVPTPVCVIDCKDLGEPIIATGGIRSGLDVARAIALGATCAGMANALLKSATVTAGATIEKLQIVVEELKAAMFLTSSANLVELQQCGPIIMGKTKEWLDSWREINATR